MDISHLQSLSTERIASTSAGFKRFLVDKINWNSRLIGIKGARGTGKTTMLLQWLAEKPDSKERLYISLDGLYFSSQSFIDVAEAFYRLEGRFLAIDEVHKYREWSRELKNIYDRYPGLYIVFTGSSIVDISRQEFDLSRRAIMYTLPGLSYREYLAFKNISSLPVLTLEQIINQDIQNLLAISVNWQPLAHLADYLRKGYYPYLLGEPDSTTSISIMQLVRMIVEYDMAEMKDFDVRNAKKCCTYFTYWRNKCP